MKKIEKIKNEGVKRIMEEKKKIKYKREECLKGIIDK